MIVKSSSESLCYLNNCATIFYLHNKIICYLSRRILISFCFNVFRNDHQVAVEVQNPEPGITTTDEKNPEDRLSHQATNYHSNQTEQLQEQNLKDQIVMKIQKENETIPFK